MIPQLMTIRVRPERGRGVRLWIPVLPLLLVLSPVLVLVLLALVVACLASRINPVRALYAGTRLLCALRGTRIHVEQGRQTVLVAIR
jgi:hypothetical protein